MELTAPGLASAIVPRARDLALFCPLPFSWSRSCRPCRSYFHGVRARQCCFGGDTGSFGTAGQSGTKGLWFVHCEGAVRTTRQKSKDRKRGQCPADGPCCVQDGTRNAPSSQSGFSTVKGAIILSASKSRLELTNAYRYRQMVQSDKGLWIHSAAGWRQRCVRSYFS